MPITTTPSGNAQGEYSTYTPIYSTTLTSSVSSVSFNNIPQNYTDLVIVSNFFVSATDYTIIRFNGDSSSSYSHLKFYDNGGTTVGGSMGNNLTGFLNTHYGLTSANNAMGILNVMNYSNASFYKTILIEDSYGAPNEHTFVTGTWRSLSPVTSVQMSRTTGNFTSGSTFTVYGIKAAVSAPKATGGNVVYSDGNYWYHTFTATDTFIPYSTLSCDVLVVGGGGAGGGFGGGGAGGYRTATSFSFTGGTSYPATVGAGGATATGNASLANNGSDSSISTITSTGGGGGGNYNNTYMDGRAGGSGGGAGTRTGSGGAGAAGLGNTPSTSPSQGNNGGAGDTTNNGAGGGGGGGAAAQGSAFTGSFSSGTSRGGNGGAGSLWSPTQTYYAGGGAGSAYNLGPATGGVGGGGAGGVGVNATKPASGTANSGGGGGATYAFISDTYAGAGGSGVIIVRYPV